MKEFVRSVTGDIAPEELNWCQCHEHIFLEKCRSAEVSPVLLMQDFDKSAAELKEYKAAGGSSIVDAQPAFSGRMAAWLMRASEKSGVKIIASTGFHKTVFYYPDSIIFTYNEDQLTDFFVEEIEIGMIGDNLDNYARTGIRAGVIKTAVDRGGIYQDKIYTKLFEAAANAAVRTGSPVLAHIEQQADAIEAVDFFINRGIDPERIIICHLDRARPDFEYNKDCADTGVFLEYDTINRVKYHSDAYEADLISYMLDHGFKDRLLMGLDTTNKRLKHYGADMGLDYILNIFAPYLIERGTNGSDIELIMVHNPRRALKFILN